MRALCLLVFLIYGGSYWAQTYSSNLWIETGVKYNLSKKVSLGGELTQRYAPDGLNTWFPQASVKYKLTKWCRPSIDYRLISKKEFSGVYTVSHRINGNLQFNLIKKRLDLGFRVRYQQSFDKLGSGYNSEFDNAWRFQPSFAYDLNDFLLTPNVSAEFFYNPENAANGHQFTRVRYFIGFDLDIESPHGFSFGYYFDQRINEGNPNQRHIINLGYTYSIAKKNNSKKPTNKSIKDF